MERRVRILLAALAWLAFSGEVNAAPLIAPIVAAVGLTGAAASVATAVISIAASVGLSLAARALSPKPKRQAASAADAPSMQVTVREPLASRRVVYGRTRVAGTIVYQQSTGGDRYLHMVLVLCEGPIDAVETVYFNDTPLSLDGSGNVTSGPFAGKTRVRIALGDQNQAADSALISQSGGKWTAAHQGRGVAYLYVRLEWDQNVWTQGVPNITAIVRGLKLYDPRSGTTAWSQNAALIMRNFLLRAWAKGGVGATSAEIDDANIIAQANICDEAVNLAAGGTEPRYQAAGIIDLDGGNTPQERLQDLLTSCGGRLTFSGGVYRLFVAAWRSTTATIMDDMLRAAITVETRISRREQFNAVKGSFTKPAERYIPADYPAVIVAAYEAQDNNERVYTDRPLLWTTSAATAQRLARLELERSRRALTVTLPCNLMAYQVAVGDVVAVTHAKWGWTAKTFECVGWRWSLEDGEGGPTLGVDLTLRETDATVYGWTTGQEAAPNPPPTTTLPDWRNPDAPSTVDALSSIFVSTTVYGTRSRTVISWTPPVSAFIVAYDVRYKLAIDSIWQYLPRTADTAIGIDDLPSGTYDFGVRAVNAAGALSAWASVTRVVDAVYSPPQVSWEDLRPKFLEEAVINPLLTEDEILVQHFVDGVFKTVDIARVEAKAGDASALISIEATARAQADLAMASQITTLSTTVAGNSTTITQQALSITDLQGQTYGSWSVKIATQAVTSGGTVTAITGFGLVQQGGGGTISSTFAVYADRFVVLPSYSSPTQALAQRPVFVVGTTPDGAGVGINGNLFVDGSIGARSITVGTLSALTGNMGTLTVGAIQTPDGKFVIDATNARMVISS